MFNNYIKLQSVYVTPRAHVHFLRLHGYSPKYCGIKCTAQLFVRMNLPFEHSPNKSVSLSFQTLTIAEETTHSIGFIITYFPSAHTPHTLLNPLNRYLTCLTVPNVSDVLAVLVSLFCHKMGHSGQSHQLTKLRSERFWAFWARFYSRRLDYASSRSGLQVWMWECRER
jgi:hypothetical protein